MQNELSHGLCLGISSVIAEKGAAAYVVLCPERLAGSSFDNAFFLHPTPSHHQHSCLAAYPSVTWHHVVLC